MTAQACRSDKPTNLLRQASWSRKPELAIRKSQLRPIGTGNAFLGRLVIIPYFPIRDEAMKKIILLKLGKIQQRIKENHKIDLSYDDALVNEVARRCTEVESGARNVDNILTNTLLPEVSKQILGKMAEGEKPSSIRVSVGDDGSFIYA